MPDACSVEGPGSPVTARIAFPCSPRAHLAGAQKRVLIVNCYFDDDSREPRPRVRKLPKTMAPVYLAGAFSAELCDVRVYCEMYSEIGRAHV